MKPISPCNRCWRFSPKCAKATFRHKPLHEPVEFAFQLPIGTRHAQAKNRRAQAPTRTQTPPFILPQPRTTGKLKPGTHWSDEYRERMQADMDALTSR